MNYILADFNIHTSLLPFTYTRPTSGIRCGILTLQEKWEKHLGATVSHLTQDYLQDKYPLITSEDNLVIAGHLFVNNELLTAINDLQIGQKLMNSGEVIAFSQ